uniref:Uncharacterized protein n=1 Tax=Leersia perrieri TaxID=77586 RepID=A0A0D9Y0I9_9ORYZ
MGWHKHTGPFVMGPLGLTGPLHRLPFFLPHPFAAGAADEAAGNGRRRPISWRISDFRPAGGQWLNSCS